MHTKTHTQTQTHSCTQTHTQGVTKRYNKYKTREDSCLQSDTINPLTPPSQSAHMHTHLPLLLVIQSGLVAISLRSSKLPGRQIIGCRSWRHRAHCQFIVPYKMSEDSILNFFQCKYNFQMPGLKYRNESRCLVEMVPWTCGPWRLLRMLQVAKKCLELFGRRETIKYIKQYY